ncbi:DEAD-box ATP-dependent RNA helicase 39-like isoform X1 [Ricinus communis]|uniref:DEAD-box ATP-dependent RNA helicase 39-like isoform X1 n=1 Tax=Ricinus communis TaxID=3988 RepID=UPI00201AC77B|nr:DEAD-box ATP-dependent RNA helicase 39-like isoform X1 [Ricinus communis]
MAGTSRTLLSLSLSTATKHYYPFLRFPKPSRVLLRFNFKPLCTTTASATGTETSTTTTFSDPDQAKHSILLERLRLRHLKNSSKTQQLKTQTQTQTKLVVNVETEKDDSFNKSKKGKKIAGSFEELSLSDEVMGAVREMEIEVPTEIQCIGIPAVLDGKSVVLGSHTGSGKTLAYMLPLVQLLRRDEALLGLLMKPRRPRAIVLCPTRELSEQVFRVAKSISHHARFRSTMVSGGGRMRPQEDSLNSPIDMIVGTPGRILQHIEDGNMVYGDIKYLVLDEADTMFDRGFGPDIRKFLGPLKNRASKPDGLGFQTILVTATMTKAVQKLIDEEFQGIVHLRTSTLHKKIASARHDFIKLSGSENKLEALLQVLEPSLAKGNRVMVFCNTLNSSRAVDHFLAENQISTVNYHGEVPAEQRVENLQKFKSDDGDCPTLVCTDLAARGLDLDVDHVVMFDFPLNSIDYLHRTGRTARMGAKGKVTSLVAKKDLQLAARIEEAIRKNESLESLTTDNVRRDIARAQITEQKGKKAKLIKLSSQKNKINTIADKSSTNSTKAASSVNKSRKASTPAKSVKAVKVAKTLKISRKTSSPGLTKKIASKKINAVKSTSSKLNVVPLRGRSSSSNKKNESLRRS